jgi:hypothetical protein
MQNQETVVDKLCKLRLKIGRLKTNSRVTIGDTKISAQRKMKVHKDMLDHENEFISLIEQLHVKDLPEMYRRMRYFAYDINVAAIEKLFNIINSESIIIRVKKYYTHLHNTSAQLLLIKTYCRWRGRSNNHHKAAFKRLCEHAKVDPSVWCDP